MKNALLVIDVQKIYFTKGSPLRVAGGKAILKRINDLIAAFVAAGLPIVYIRHEHKKDGTDTGRMFDFSGEKENPCFVEGTDEVDFPEDLVLVESPIIFRKTCYSAFSSAEFSNWLETNRIEELTLCGFMTNFCCDSTARDAHGRDYFVDFVLDATGCPDMEDISQDEIKKVVSATISNGFGRVLTTRRAVKGVSNP